MVEGVVGEARGDARRSSSRDLATSTHVFILSNKLARCFGINAWQILSIATGVATNEVMRAYEISLINRTRGVGASMKTRIKSREGEEEDGRSEERREEIWFLYFYYRPPNGRCHETKWHISVPYVYC